MQITVTSIIDGDTLIGAGGNKVEIRIRLDGVEAPEPGQALHEIAKQHLSELVLNRQVTLVISSAATGAGVSGRIYLGEIDIGAQMIRDGAAWFDVPHSPVQSAGPSYVYNESEKAARAERRGIWQEDSPTAPWAFRQQQEEARQRQQQPAHVGSNARPQKVRASLTSLDTSSSTASDSGADHDEGDEDGKLDGSARRAAQDAITALRRISNATAVGVKYDEYRSEVLVLKGKLDAAMSRLPSGSLRTHIAAAYSEYLYAAKIWNMMARNGFDWVSAEGNGSGNELMMKYGIEPVRARRGQRILTRQTVMSAIWTKASDHAYKATDYLN